MKIKLIVGLGNPGEKYTKTRHNAGFWFLDESFPDSQFRTQKGFNGALAETTLNQNKCFLLKPTTFMNLSGDAVVKAMQFYKIAPENLLVAHDELDFPPGICRLKQGGGHGGHNGLRDIIQKIGSRDFLRLRIGIGHPGDTKRVADYVLKPPSKQEGEEIRLALAKGYDAVKTLATQDIQSAIQQLHSN